MMQVVVQMSMKVETRTLVVFIKCPGRGSLAWKGDWIAGAPLQE
jgi:hypothetical protein